MVAFFFAALFVDNDEQAGTVHGDASAAAAFYVPQVDKLHERRCSWLREWTLADASRRTTDVECAHGQLRAGFADGLRGDDADRFAQFHHAAAGQVAAVTKGANSAAGFAGEHGTNATRSIPAA